MVSHRHVGAGGSGSAWCLAAFQSHVRRRGRSLGRIRALAWIGGRTTRRDEPASKCHGRHASLGHGGRVAKSDTRTGRKRIHRCACVHLGVSGGAYGVLGRGRERKTCLGASCAPGRSPTRRRRQRTAGHQRWLVWCTCSIGGHQRHFSRAIHLHRLGSRTRAWGFKVVRATRGDGHAGASWDLRNWTEHPGGRSILRGQDGRLGNSRVFRRRRHVLHSRRRAAVRRPSHNAAIDPSGRNGCVPAGSAVS
mmetsp:Transcript_8522/g.53255  ORF Transcript_8522/g.53255 Transcript_8522/m.53255 type:complete len:250 (+) Transcript_8522:359-1108(+)